MADVTAGISLAEQIRLVAGAALAHYPPQLQQQKPPPRPPRIQVPRHLGVVVRGRTRPLSFLLASPDWLRDNFVGRLPAGCRWWLGFQLLWASSGCVYFLLAVPDFSVAALCLIYFFTCAVACAVSCWMYKAGRAGGATQPRWLALVCVSVSVTMPPSIGEAWWAPSESPGKLSTVPAPSTWTPGAEPIHIICKTCV